VSHSKVCLVEELEVVIAMLSLELGDTLLGDRSYQYLTTDDMKMLADDSISPIKVRFCFTLHAYSLPPYPAQLSLSLSLVLSIFKSIIIFKTLFIQL